MATRTQIYLDETQRKALKMLATSLDASVSDLVRRAIDRLLAEEFAGRDWAGEARAVAKRIRASTPDLSDDEVDKMVLSKRKKARA